MTIQTTAPILSELRRIAGVLHAEAERPKADRKQLDALAGDLAAISQRISGQVLVRLPAPDETDPDRWFCDQDIIEVALDSEPRIWRADECFTPRDGRALGLALIAAADRATCPCTPDAPRHPHSQGGYRRAETTA